MAGEYSLGTATLRIYGDRSSLDRELETLKRYTAQLERQGIKVKFDADTGSADRKVDGLRNKLNGLQGVLDAIQGGLRGNGDVFSNLAAQLESAGQAAGSAGEEMNAGGAAVAGLAAKFGPLAAGALRAVPVLGQIGLAVQGLTAIFGGAKAAIQGMLVPLERLSAQAGRFNKQVAEAGIFAANTFAILGEDGEVVEGTANQMRAVRGVITKEYKEIQKEVAQISGATASEIYEGFNIILQNAGNLGKEGQDISKIRKLSTRIAAGMNTLGVPGYQLRSEVNALMMGNIGPDSMLAKKLGYQSSADIQKLQAQGKFYDDLINKLNKLYDGQTILANSLSNVKSNFQDVSETIASEGGQALERGLAGGLQSVLKTLDGLQGSFMMFVRGTNEALEPLLRMLGDIGSMFVSIGSFVSSVLAIVMDLAAVVTNLIGFAFGPTLSGVAKILQMIAKVVELLAKGIGGILRPLSGILRVATDIAKNNGLLRFFDYLLTLLGQAGTKLDEFNSKLADAGRAAAKNMGEGQALIAAQEFSSEGGASVTENERKKIKIAGEQAVANYNQTVGDDQEIDIKSLQYSQQTERLLDEISKRMGSTQGERNVAIAKDIAKIKEDTYKNEIKQLELGLKLMQAQKGVVQEQNNAREQLRKLQQQRVGFAGQLAVSPETKLDAQQRMAEVQSQNDTARMKEQAKLLNTEKDIQRVQLQIQIRQQRIQQEQLKIQQLEMRIQHEAAMAAMKEAAEKVKISRGKELEAAKKAYNKLKDEVDLRGQQVTLMRKMVSLSYEEEKLIRDTSALEQQALSIKMAALDTQRQSTMEQLQQKTLLNDYEKQQLRLGQAVKTQENALAAVREQLNRVQEEEQRRLENLERSNKLRESELENLKAVAKAEEARAENQLRLAEAQAAARDNASSVNAVIGAEIEALAQGQRGYVSILDATKAASAAREKALRFEHESQRIAKDVQRQRELSEQRIATTRLQVLSQELEVLKAKVDFESGMQKINQDRDQRAAGLGGLPPPPLALPPPDAASPIGNMLPGTKGGPNYNDGLGAGRGHQGQDLGLDVGDPIHSRRAGKVVGYIPDFRRPGQQFMGGALDVQYDNGERGRYGHIQNPAAQVGSRVEAGQRLATVFADGGNTHLHYELRDGFGKLLNPLKSIQESLRQPTGTRTGLPTAATAGAGTAGPVNSANLAQQELGNMQQQLENRTKSLAETTQAHIYRQQQMTTVLENQTKALQERQALELRQMQIDNKRNELTAEFMKQPWNKLMGEYTETFVQGFGGMVREAIKTVREGGDLGDLMTDVLERMADRYIESTLNYLLAPAEQAMTKTLFGGLTGFNPRKIEEEAAASVGPAAVGPNSAEQQAANIMTAAGNTQLKAGQLMLQAATGSQTLASGGVSAAVTGQGVPWAQSLGGQMWSKSANIDVATAFPGNLDFGSFAAPPMDLEAASGMWSASKGLSLDAAVFTGAGDGLGSLSDSAIKLGETMDKVPEKADEATGSFGNLLGGIGGLAMGVMGIVGGISSMGKGGTYNTLMGLAGIFGGIGSVTGMFGTGGVFAAKPKAIGGSVDYGRNYLVGEEGPELFVPGQSGTIIANDKIRQAMTGGSSPFQQNKQALQSGKDRSAARTAEVMQRAATVDVRFESQVINNVEYVTADQFRKGMSDSAERGKNMAFQFMQNNVSTRRRLGL